MDTDFPVELNGQHVASFLAKIARDRDRELAAIDAQVAADIGAIRTRAFADARQLARRVVTETRERERRERDRYLYKVRSELVREQWDILEQLRERVEDGIRHRFESAWRDHQRQWQWCCDWLDVGMDLAEPEKLLVECGAGTLDSVIEKARERLADYPGGAEVKRDETRPAGLVVAWPDHYLDGTLARHRETVGTQVLHRIAAILAGAGNHSQ